MHYYQFNIGDYITETVHLDPMEDLAYRRLLDLYYSSETPIPTDIPRVSRRLRMDAPVVESVLNEFFDKDAEGYRNARADAEIEKYHQYLEKQKANGSKGGRPKGTQRKSTGNPPLTQAKPKRTLNTNHKPITKNPLIPPKWVDSEAWADLHLYRSTHRVKKIREAWTELAQKKTAKSLGELTPKNQRQCVNDTIMNGYQGIFPEKYKGGVNGKPKSQSEINNEYTDRLFNRDAGSGNEGDIRPALVGGSQDGETDSGAADDLEAPIFNS